jgi:hypothetical protein
VTDFSNQDGVQNGLETTEVGVGNPGSKERADVDPEGVEGSQTESDLLAHVEGTRYSVLIVGMEGSASGSSERLGDEVGVYSNSSVVTHTFDKLNESDLKSSQRLSHGLLEWQLRTVKIFHGILAGTRRSVASSSSVGKSSASLM